MAAYDKFLHGGVEDIQHGASQLHQALEQLEVALQAKQPHQVCLLHQRLAYLGENLDLEVVAKKVSEGRQLLEESAEELLSNTFTLVSDGLGEDPDWSVGQVRCSDFWRSLSAFGSVL